MLLIRTTDDDSQSFRLPLVKFNKEGSIGDHLCQPRDVGVVLVVDDNVEGVCDVTVDLLLIVVLEEQNAEDLLRTGCVGG